MQVRFLSLATYQRLVGCIRVVRQGSGWEIRYSPEMREPDCTHLLKERYVSIINITIYKQIAKVADEQTKLCLQLLLERQVLSEGSFAEFINDVGKAKKEIKDE